jgi:hypothetical protein
MMPRIKKEVIVKDCQCYAKAIDPQRQEMWKRIFPPDGKVPITCPIPVGRANLAGQEAEYYLVDFDRVSEDEKFRLITEISEKFNLSPLSVAQDIKSQGAPIKADGVLVTWCKIHSLAAM